jgi:Ca-activated chloride channel family protein
MTLLAPQWLLLLVPVTALVAGYVVLQRRRRAYAARYASPELLGSVAPVRHGWRRHVPAVAVLVGLVALVVGLAHPARDEKVPRE